MQFEQDKKTSSIFSDLPHIIVNHCLIMLRLVVTLLLMVTTVRPQDTQRAFLCDLCQNVVTDMETWLTSDNTIDQIINFMDEVSKGQS